MNYEELTAKYKDAPKEPKSRRVFYPWEAEIFSRIENAIVGDEEALALLEHTIQFAADKSRCAGV